jgi:D-beta-D-heptose 7-phosphate kinase/D-beta-D-heptose 1-phosphate adenosyltransferase
MHSLNDIQSKNILVIGDIMLDTYYTGDVERISPESPVPVFRKSGEHSVLGGAANVAANLIAAGQNVSVMSIIGNDEVAKKLRILLDFQGINSELLFELNRKTTEKTRFLASNNQQVLRLDVEDTVSLDKDICRSMIIRLEKKIMTFDLILLSDYLKGLLTFELVQSIICMAATHGIPVIIDVKGSYSEKYCGATLLKPNLKELRELSGFKADTYEDIIAASEYLKVKSNVKYVLTTCGEHGMILIGDGEPYCIKANGQKVFDVTGAGDTAIAYIGTCMVNKFSMKEAIEIANLAAGIQVSKIGTNPVYWFEIREKFNKEKNGSIYKIIRGKNIENFRKEHSNHRIVFTNGCFDILHVGHIRYLQKAATMGDIMVIGLNSDASVNRLKGSGRPINTVEDRAEMLSALNFVDYIIIFEEDSPLELIKKIKPDILVKGGDYTLDNVIGKKEVEEGGGKFVLIAFVEGRSTTRIIEKIKY